jgi:hypothetical protein
MCTKDRYKLTIDRGFEVVCIGKHEWAGLCWDNVASLQTDCFVLLRIRHDTWLGLTCSDNKLFFRHDHVLSWLLLYITCTETTNTKSRLLISHHYTFQPPDVTNTARTYRYSMAFFSSHPQRPTATQLLKIPNDRKRKHHNLHNNPPYRTLLNNSNEGKSLSNSSSKFREFQPVCRFPYRILGCKP